MFAKLRVYVLKEEGDFFGIIVPLVFTKVHEFDTDRGYGTHVLDVALAIHNSTNTSYSPFQRTQECNFMKDVPIDSVSDDVVLLERFE